LEKTALKSKAILKMARKLENDISADFLDYKASFDFNIVEGNCSRLTPEIPLHANLNWMEEVGAD